MKDYTKINQSPSVPQPTASKQTVESKDQPISAALYICFTILLLIVLYTVVNEVSKNDTETKYKATPQYTSISPLPEPPVRIKTEDPYKNPFPEIKQHIGIETAYAITNVQRVAYTKESSRLPANISDYLSELFNVTDFLVIERMQNQRLLTAKKPLHLKAYDLAVAKLKSMTAPQQLTEAHALIVSAIINQKTYFELMQQTGEKFSADHVLVQTSSKQLIKAWKIMGRELKTEEKRNLFSFEKHLCALDFI